MATVQYPAITKPGSRKYGNDTLTVTVRDIEVKR